MQKKVNNILCNNDSVILFYSSCHEMELIQNPVSLPKKAKNNNNNKTQNKNHTEFHKYAMYKMQIKWFLPDAYLTMYQALGS